MSESVSTPIFRKFSFRLLGLVALAFALVAGLAYWWGTASIPYLSAVAITCCAFCVFSMLLWLALRKILSIHRFTNLCNFRINGSYILGFLVFLCLIASAEWYWQVRHNFKKEIASIYTIGINLYFTGAISPGDFFEFERVYNKARAKPERVIVNAKSEK